MEGFLALKDSSEPSNWNQSVPQTEPACCLSHPNDYTKQLTDLWRHVALIVPAVLGELTKMH